MFIMRFRIWMIFSYHGACFNGAMSMLQCVLLTLCSCCNNLYVVCQCSCCNTLRAILGEILGTFFLIFLGCGGASGRTEGSVDLLHVAFAFGLGKHVI